MTEQDERRYQGRPVVVLLDEEVTLEHPVLVRTVLDHAERVTVEGTKKILLYNPMMACFRSENQGYLF